MSRKKLSKCSKLFIPTSFGGVTNKPPSRFAFERGVALIAPPPRHMLRCFCSIYVLEHTDKVLEHAVYIFAFQIMN